MRLFAIIVCAVLFTGFQEKDEEEQGAEIRTDGRSCLFAPLALVPDHNPIDARCDFINKIDEEERQRNSPKNDLFKGTWKSRADVPTILTLQGNVLEDLNPAIESGRTDDYKRLVLLEEDIESQRAIFFVREEYDVMWLTREPPAPRKWNDHSIIMLSKDYSPTFKEVALRWSYCVIRKDQPKPIVEMTDEEIKQFYQEYLLEAKKEVAIDDNLHDLWRCWPNDIKPHKFESGSYWFYYRP